MANDCNYDSVLTLARAVAGQVPGHPGVWHDTATVHLSAESLYHQLPWHRHWQCSSRRSMLDAEELPFQSLQSGLQQHVLVQQVAAEEHTHHTHAPQHGVRLLAPSTLLSRHAQQLNHSDQKYKRNHTSNSCLPNFRSFTGKFRCGHDCHWMCQS